MKSKLYISQIEDPYIQTNFKTFGEIFNGSPFLKGEWRFIEFSLNTSGTDIRIKHNFNFRPTDMLVLSVRRGTLTVKFDSFDDNFIVVDATVTSAPMTIRAIIGRYSEETIGV